LNAVGQFGTKIIIDHKNDLLMELVCPFL